MTLLQMSHIFLPFAPPTRTPPCLQLVVVWIHGLQTGVHVLWLISSSEPPHSPHWDKQKANAIRSHPYVESNEQNKLMNEVKPEARIHGHTIYKSFVLQHSYYQFSEPFLKIPSDYLIQWMSSFNKDSVTSPFAEEAFLYLCVFMCVCVCVWFRPLTPPA